MKKVYLTFDGRACGCMDSDPWDTGAIVLETSDSLEEAKEACGDYGDMACFSYEEEIVNEEHHLKNASRKWVFDWYIKGGLNDGQSPFPNKFARAKDKI